MGSKYLALIGQTGSGPMVYDSVGTEITGNLRLSVDFLTHDPSAIQYLLSKGNAYHLYISATDEIVLQYADQTGTNRFIVSDNGISLSAGVRTTLGAFLDWGAGEVTFYVNGVQHGAAKSTVGTAIQSDETDIYLGRYDDGLPLTGGIFGAQIYDDSDDLVMDVDLTSLTISEIEAGAFVCNTGQNVALLGSEWTIVRPKTSIAGVDWEALWEAGDGNKFLTPLWADRSGHGHHHAPVSSPVGAAFYGQKYAKHPGTANNFLSTPDTNLFPASAANLQQSSAYFDALGGTNNEGLSQVLTPVFGTYHGALQINGTPASVYVYNQIGAASASAATQYTASIALAASLSGYEASIYIAWLDSGKSGLSDSTPSAYADVGTDFSGSRHTVTATSPASTAFARIVCIVRKKGGGNLDDDEWIYVDAGCFRAGTSSVFVPSMRIDRDLDIEVKVMSPDYGSAYQYLMNLAAGGSTGYALLLSDSNEIRMDFAQDDGTYRGVTSTTASLVNDTTYTIRGTWTKAGVVTLKVDDVTVGSASDSGYADGGLYTDNNDTLEIGALNGGSLPLTGNVFYLEVRDGIGGPVVARFDAGDAEQPATTQVGVIDGRTWTWNRSSSGHTLTLIDEDQWLLTTDDGFLTSHATAFDIGTDEGFTMFVVSRLPDVTVSGHQVLCGAGSFTALAGFHMFAHESDGNLDSYITGASTSVDGNGISITDKVKFVGTLQLDRSTPASQLFKDGAGSAAQSTDPGAIDVGTFRIGCHDGGSAFMTGAIMMVAFTRSVLTQDQIDAVVNELSGNSGKLLLLGAG
jgi:Concanavalin A-like lectin/glucanases superfamily